MSRLLFLHLIFWQLPFFLISACQHGPQALIFVFALTSQVTSSHVLAENTIHTEGGQLYTGACSAPPLGCLRRLSNLTRSKLDFSFPSQTCSSPPSVVSTCATIDLIACSKPARDPSCLSFLHNHVPHPSANPVNAFSHSI